MAHDWGTAAQLIGGGQKVDTGILMNCSPFVTLLSSSEIICCDFNKSELAVQLSVYLNMEYNLCYNA